MRDYQERMCERCGVRYKPKRSDQRYCWSKCGDAARLKRYRGRMKLGGTNAKSIKASDRPGVPAEDRNDAEPEGGHAVSG